MSFDISKSNESKQLVEGIVRLFSDKLKEDVLPISFNIILHPEEFDQVCDSFEGLIPQAVAKFYKVLESNKSKHPKMQRPKKWYFQFSKNIFAEDPRTGKNEFLRAGGIVIFMSPMPLVYRSEDSKSICKEGISINLDDVVDNYRGRDCCDILGLQSIAPYTYVYSETSELSEPLAKLICRIGLFTKRSYEMTDNFITISGEEDSNVSGSVFRIDTPLIGSPHFQIKYDADIFSFSIATFYPARLNNRELTESSIESPIWNRLERNSIIKIEYEGKVWVKIKFK